MIYLNGVEIVPTIFPDKTSQIWKVPQYLISSYTTQITWKFESEGELIQICQLVDIIKSEYPDKKIILDMPYLPYGRQDKDVCNSQTFALKTFSKIINSMNFEKVTSYDPHSEKAGRWIYKFEEKTNDKEVWKTIGMSNADIVCYPDKGAVKKYAERIGHTHIIGEKERDPSSGLITKYNLLGDAEISGMKILIVDDICDGGATFVHLAKALHERKAAEIHLFVSHGIFSKGIQVLKDAGIQRIFTKEGEVK